MLQLIEIFDGEDTRERDFLNQYNQYFLKSKTATIKFLEVYQNVTIEEYNS